MTHQAVLNRHWTRTLPECLFRPPGLRALVAQRPESGLLPFERRSKDAGSLLKGAAAQSGKPAPKLRLDIRGFALEGIDRIGFGDKTARTAFIRWGGSLRRQR